MPRPREQKAGTTTPSRAAVYVRVSTASQVDGTSLDGQLDVCRSEIGRHGWTVVEVYSDAGVSGARASRPALDRLVDDAEAGRVDVVVVSRLDRLGRSLPHLAGLVARLHEQGVRLLAISDGIDTGTDTGRLLVGILGSIAEWERTRIFERTAEGLARRAAEGGFVSSTAPHGYQAVPDVKRGRGVVLAINPTAAACIRAMYDLLVAQRVSMRTAVERLNAAGHRSASGQPWSVETLSRWARGSAPETCAGTWRWGEHEVPIPAIITAAELVEWRAWIADTTTPQTDHGGYLLSGFVTTLCGRRFLGRTATGQTPTYTCRHRTTARGDNKCGCLNIAVDALDNLVWGRVETMLTDPGALRELAAEAAGLRVDPADVGAQIAAATAAVTDLQSRIATDYQAAIADGFDATTARQMMSGLRAELVSAQSSVSQLGKARARVRRAGSDRLLRDTAERIRRDVGAFTVVEKRAVFGALGVRVDVTGYEPCSSCGGSGYEPCPPGSGRRWPPRCVHCARMRMLPVVELSISSPERLLVLADDLDAADTA